MSDAVIPECLRKGGNATLSDYLTPRHSRSRLTHKNATRAMYERILGFRGVTGKDTKPVHIGRAQISGCVSRCRT